MKTDREYPGIMENLEPLPSGLREGTLNALIHRDSFDIVNLITINVYDDHIWLSNPGGLPEGILFLSIFLSMN